MPWPIWHIVTFGIGALVGLVALRDKSKPLEPGATEEQKKDHEAELSAHRWLRGIVGGCALIGILHLFQVFEDGPPSPGYLWSDDQLPEESRALYYRLEGKDYQVRLFDGKLRYGGNKHVPGGVKYYTGAQHDDDRGSEGPRYGYPVD